MSTPIANPAINTFLKLSDHNCPETFATVANVSSIVGFSMSGMVVDVTSHSNADPWRRKIVTLLDAGDLTCTIYFIPDDAGHRLLQGEFVNRGQVGQGGRTPSDWQLSIPTVPRETVQFTAFLSKFNMDFPVDGVIKATITLTVVGEPIFPGVND